MEEEIRRRMNPVLFGHSPDARIVAAHQAGDDAMRVYVRTGKTIEAEERPFYPFFFLSEPKLI